MRGRGPLASLSASPTMVGAVTTLIVIVAVFLAYNANNGLPFVPVYRVSVEVPNAARLTNNNEVRIGGHRVGVVESIEPVQSPVSRTTAQAGGGEALANDTGGAIARLNLKLDKSAGPLPKDSIFRVRYRSSFGLKYLEIVRGTGDKAPENYVFNGTDDGATCALPLDPEGFSERVSDGDPETESGPENGCYQVQTEFDDINNTFDGKTREAARENLVGFGNAFAGRGVSLNDAINELAPLFRGLEPVARTLSDPDTELARFFGELGDAARIVLVDHAPFSVSSYPVATASKAGRLASSEAADADVMVVLGRPLTEGAGPSGLSSRTSSPPSWRWPRISSAGWDDKQPDGARPRHRPLDRTSSHPRHSSAA